MRATSDVAVHTRRRVRRFERRPASDDRPAGLALARQLFVLTAGAPRWENWGVVAALPLAAAIVVIRASATLATTTVWAEDGRQFFADAVNKGLFGSLLVPYSGYIHVPARLLAALAAVRPADAAFVFAAGSGLVVAALAAFVFVAARGHVPSPVLRALLAASMVLLPVAGAETLANAANLHWFFMFAAFWATLFVPRGWLLRIAACVIVFFAITSDPFPLLFAPVIGLRFATSLPWRDKLALPVAYLAGAPLQVIGVLRTTQPESHPSFGNGLRTYPLRIILTTATGFRAPTRLFGDFGWSIAVLAVLAAAVVLVVLFALGDRRAVVLPALSLGLSVAMFVLYMGIRWSDDFSPVRGQPVVGANSRYSIVPSLLLLTAVVVLVTRLRAPQMRALATGALLVVLPITWVIDFRVENGRGTHPTWAEAVHAAGQACQRGAARAHIELLPLAEPGLWQADVPCSAILK